VGEGRSTGEASKCPGKDSGGEYSIHRHDQHERKKDARTRANTLPGKGRPCRLNELDNSHPAVVNERRRHAVHPGADGGEKDAERTTYSGKPASLDARNEITIEKKKVWSAPRLFNWGTGERFSGGEVPGVSGGRPKGGMLGIKGEKTSVNLYRTHRSFGGGKLGRYGTATKRSRFNVDHGGRRAEGNERLEAKKKAKKAATIEPTHCLNAGRARERFS